MLLQRLAQKRITSAVAALSISNMRCYKKACVGMRMYSSDIEFYKPQPIRKEFTGKKLTTADLESLNIGLGQHRKANDLTDAIAFGVVKFLRVFADLFFRKRYIHRAIVLETVAAVPVAGMQRHLTSLRLLRHDGGWIHHLLHEAENERMHLMTWMKLTQPSMLERALIFTVQGVFFNLYFLAYLFFPRLSHRIVGYLEEEAVISYTGFLKEIDEGRISNDKAPKIAITYWNLQDDATIRDVVLAIRADEATHRDVNHHLADRIVLGKVDLKEELEPTEIKRLVNIVHQKDDHEKPKKQ